MGDKFRGREGITLHKYPGELFHRDLLARS